MRVNSWIVSHGNYELISAISKLARYAYARDRATEKEPRTITLTDDEALAIVEHMREMEAELDM